MPLITTRSAASARGLGLFQQVGARTTPISGYELWLDSADASSFTYSSGSVISRWTDRSANAYFFEPSSTTMAPARTGTQNGKPTVVFDGTDDGLLCTSAASAWKFLHDGTQSTVFVVYKDGEPTPPGFGNEAYLLDTTGDFYNILYSNKQGISYQVGGFSSSGTNYWSNGLNVNSGVIYSGQTYSAYVQANMYPGNGWVITSDLLDVNNATSASRINRYINNQPFNNTSLSFYGWTAGSTTAPPTALSIGRINNSTNYAAFKGEIAEIIMYKRKLSIAEKDEMVTYLKSKWNI